MFRNKIGYWAKEKGLKHRYLASCCGVSEQTFSRWVRNGTQPDLKQSFILAKLFGISVDDLGEYTEETKKAPLK
ncbi:helix-turn-helix transcriptional regulator [Pseudobacillus sp. 179-B 2D1 NHS]|uniref:helix-turn-helix transcriptional regulator n=1 Tax=Pseudobacillus sp. 179-B 2D1 NHS TaxID=3374292 RepID=UPI0038797143